MNCKCDGLFPNIIEANLTFKEHHHGSTSEKALWRAVITVIRLDSAVAARTVAYTCGEVGSVTFEVVVVELWRIGPTALG